MFVSGTLNLEVRRLEAAVFKCSGLGVCIRTIPGVPRPLILYYIYDTILYYILFFVILYYIPEIISGILLYNVRYIILN